MPPSLFDLPRMPSNWPKPERESKPEEGPEEDQKKELADRPRKPNP